jgi:4-hydroxy-tetrahydrodipicolinate synthase
MPNVAGLKQSVGAIDRDTLVVLASTGPEFSLLCGEDAFLFPLVLLGATGGITAASHVCTDRFVQMVECGLAGKLDEGRRHHEALLPVIAAGFAEPNPTVFKATLHAQGKIPTPDVRLPLVAASQGSVDACLAAVSAAS